MAKLTSFDDLSPQQKEKLSHIKSSDEFLAFAKDEGFELTDEQIEAISAGSEEARVMLSPLDQSAARYMCLDQPAAANKDSLEIPSKITTLFRASEDI